MNQPGTKIRRLHLESLESRRVLAAEIFHNIVDPEDVNDDGRINVADAFIAIDEIRVGSHGHWNRLADVDADGRVSFKDIHQVIARIRDGGETQSPLEERIAKLNDAIENHTLPERVSMEKAEALLLRLTNRLETQETQKQLRVAGELGAIFTALGEGGAEPVATNSDPTPQANHGGDSDPNDWLGAIHEAVSELDHDALLARLHELNPFEHLDEDGDGGLSSEEVPIDVVWKQLLNGDRDGDQTLTEEELVDYGKQLANEQLDHVIDLLDHNNDDAIGPDEVGNIAWMFLRGVDQNEDGKVTVGEITSTIRGLPAWLHEDV